MSWQVKHIFHFNHPFVCQISIILNLIKIFESLIFLLLGQFSLHLVSWGPLFFCNSHLVIKMKCSYYWVFHHRQCELWQGELTPASQWFLCMAYRSSGEELNKTVTRGPYRPDFIKSSATQCPHPTTPSWAHYRNTDLKYWDSQPQNSWYSSNH